MYLLFNASSSSEWLMNNLQAMSWSSHFFLWRPARLLLDCGEGTAMRLDDHIFRVEVMAITHGHADHCRGVIGFLHMRANLKGANEKPLTILCPGNSRLIQPHVKEVRATIERARGRLDFAHLQEVDTTIEFPLPSKSILQATEVPHLVGESCLAYRVGRVRQRLRSQFRQMPKEQIEACCRAGRGAEMMEPYFQCQMAYSGDTDRLDPDFCRGAQVLIHEATFLREADQDRCKGRHATVRDALKCAVDSGARALVLFHMSRRYEPAEIQRVVSQQIEEFEFRGPVMIVRGSFNLQTD